MRIVDRVGPGGVSAFLNEAAQVQLARAEAYELLDYLDATYGAPTEAELAKAEAELGEVFGW